LRIKAFLALVECPCSRMANALKEVLDSEPTYQGKMLAMLEYETQIIRG
jgi:hypothetical protein